MSSNLQKPEPVLIDQYGDFSIVFTGHEFMGPVARNLVAGQSRTRYADLCGPEIHKVMPLVGWYFVKTPVCIAALDAKGNTVAAGWCAGVKTDNGQIGSNLSYAVSQDHEGRGLAKLMTAIAFLLHDMEEDDNHFVNVQCRVTNQSSTAIAASFSMEPNEHGAFSVVLGQERVNYHGFRADPEQFREAAIDTLTKRGLHEIVADVKQFYAQRLATSANPDTEVPAPR